MPGAVQAPFAPPPGEQLQQQTAAETAGAEARVHGLFSLLQAFTAAVDAVDPHAAIVAKKQILKEYSDVRSTVLMLKTSADLAATDAMPAPADVESLNRLVALLSQTETLLCMRAAPCMFRGSIVVPISGTASPG